MKKPSKTPKSLKNKRLKNFHPELTELQPIRVFVEEMCKNAPGNANYLIDQLQLALNEIFCNIVKYSDLNVKKEKIKIEIELKSEGVFVTISERGKVFDPTELRFEKMPKSREGGYGWYIVTKIVDEVAYMSKKGSVGWNTLTIYKKYME